MFHPLFISALLTSTALADTWIVDDDGKADFDNIYLAVAAASDGDVILVMEGTYYASYINPHGKAILVEGETNSKGELLVTVDGMQSGAILECYSGEGPDTVFRNLILTNGSSYYGGGMTLFDGSSPTIENCIFRNNLGTIEGGGIHLRENCNPIITNCRFEDNIASGPGGGMFCIDNSNPTLTDCIFTNNSGDFGGGVYLNSSNPILDGCTFTNNNSLLTGGGIHIELSHPTITNCLFNSNECPDGFGGGICVVDGILSLQDCEFVGNVGGIGGGVYNQPEYESFHEVHGCTFKNNQAVNGNYGHGGGLNHARGHLNLSNSVFIKNTASGGGGGISEYASNGMLVRSCDFSGNIAQGGGGIDAGGTGGYTVISSTFSGNHSSSYGGGIQIAGPYLYMSNCRLTNNVADWLGGAILVLYADQQPAMFVNCLIDNNTTYAGATVSIHGTLASEFINTTIINNFGPGLAVEGWEGQYVNVHNSVIWGNEPISISIDGKIEVNVRYSDIEGGWAGEGNINADPQILFKNDSVELDSNSPCIDSGNDAMLPNDALDLDGDGDTLELLPIDFLSNLRLGGMQVDMGAIEYHAPYCLGDLNGNSVVNVTDLLIVIDQWGSSNTLADLNNDGVVDVSDLLILVGDWGPCE